MELRRLFTWEAAQNFLKHFSFLASVISARSGILCVAVNLKVCVKFEADREVCSGDCCCLELGCDFSYLEEQVC